MFCASCDHVFDGDEHEAHRTHCCGRILCRSCTTAGARALSLLPVDDSASGGGTTASALSCWYCRPGCGSVVRRRPRGSAVGPDAVKAATATGEDVPTGSASATAANLKDVAVQEYMYKLKRALVLTKYVRGQRVVCVHSVILHYMISFCVMRGPVC